MTLGICSPPLLCQTSVVAIDPPFESNMMTQNACTVYFKPYPLRAYSADVPSTVKDNRNKVFAVNVLSGSNHDFDVVSIAVQVHTWRIWSDTSPLWG
jgi:hypothetical protein